MEIKIVTWNMAYWTHKGLLKDAWKYFLDDIDADFYLFQEARPSLKIEDDKEKLVWNVIGGSRPWGSGIYSKNYKLSEEKIKTEYNGVFSIANTEVKGTKLIIISLYGLITDGYSITNLHRMLSDLTPILNGHKDIILGGDLNASLQFDTNNNSHRIFFERLEDFKLNDCFKLSGKEFPVQTLRRPDSDIKWQNDYFFVSKSLSEKFSCCEVIDNESVRKFSDHNPVVVTLEV